MSILLLILTVIGGLIILVLVIAAFVKSGYTIERSIAIARPKQIVFDYIKYLKNQDYYSKWVLMDPAMKKLTAVQAEHPALNRGGTAIIKRWEKESKK